MPSIEDMVVGEPTTTLLKGPSGFGKTIAAASYPAPVYFADFDGRIDPIRSYYRGDRKREIYYDSYGIHNLFPFLDLLDNVLEHGVVKVDGRTFRPGTIVGDSFTALSITTVNYQLNEVRTAAKKDRKVATKRTQGGIIIPDWDEYKGETSVFTQVLDVCKAIPKRHGIHVVWTAHPTKGIKVGTDERGRVAVTTKVAPIVAIGGKAAELVPNYFNEIYHFGFQPPMNLGEKGKRIVFTQTIGDDMAKTSMLLPSSFEWTDSLFHDDLMEWAKKGEENGGDFSALIKQQMQESSGW